jgi:hypothetical protein
MGQYTILSSSIKYTGGIFNCATVFDARKEAYKKLKQVIKRRKNLTDKDLTNLKFKITKVKKLKGGIIGKYEEEDPDEDNDLVSLLNPDRNIKENNNIKEKKKLFENIKDIETNEINRIDASINNKLEKFKIIKEHEAYKNLYYINYNEEIQIFEKTYLIKIIYNFYKYIKLNNNDKNILEYNIDNKTDYIVYINNDTKFNKIKNLVNEKINNDNIGILILAICVIFNTEDNYLNFNDNEEYITRIKQFIINYNSYTDEEIEASKKSLILKIIDKIIRNIKTNLTFYKNSDSFNINNLIAYVNIIKNNKEYKPYINSIKEDSDNILNKLIDDIINEKITKDEKDNIIYITGGYKKKPTKKPTKKPVKKPKKII